MWQKMTHAKRECDKKMTHAKRDKKLFMSQEAAHRRKRAYNKASLYYLGGPLLYVNIKTEFLDLEPYMAGPSMAPRVTIKRLYFK